VIAAKFPHPVYADAVFRCDNGGWARIRLLVTNCIRSRSGRDLLRETPTLHFTALSATSALLIDDDPASCRVPVKCVGGRAAFCALGGWEPGRSGPIRGGDFRWSL